MRIFSLRTVLNNMALPKTATVAEKQLKMLVYFRTKSRADERSYAVSLIPPCLKRLLLLACRRSLAYTEV